MIVRVSNSHTFITHSSGTCNQRHGTYDFDIVDACRCDRVWIQYFDGRTHHQRGRSQSFDTKEKDGTDVVGNIIKVKAVKSRLTKENSQVETRLFYDERGLDKYYGLLELGEKYGIFQRIGNRYRVGESSVYPKSILADPEKYFTEEVMHELDEAAKKEFCYGE